MIPNTCVKSFVLEPQSLIRNWFSISLHVQPTPEVKKESKQNWSRRSRGGGPKSLFDWGDVYTVWIFANSWAYAACRAGRERNLLSRIKDTARSVCLSYHLNKYNYQLSSMNPIIQGTASVHVKSMSGTNLLLFTWLTYFTYHANIGQHFIKRLYLT